LQNRKCEFEAALVVRSGPMMPTLPGNWFYPFYKSKHHHNHMIKVMFSIWIIIIIITTLKQLDQS